MLRIKYVEFVWKYTGEWYVFDTYQLHVKAMKYYCNIIIWMEMEKSKVLIQFLVIFRQFGDVLSFLYARRLRGYTATPVNFSRHFWYLETLNLKVSTSCKNRTRSLARSCKTMHYSCRHLSKILQESFYIYKFLARIALSSQCFFITQNVSDTFLSFVFSSTKM